MIDKLDKYERLLPNDWILNNSQWIFAGFLGYFGKERNLIFDILNEKYGVNNWKIAYKIGYLCIERDFALQFYEDAYFIFFLNNPDILNWLIDNYSDVYDNSLTNINSKFDYYIQENDGTHLQDIAIRKCLLRLGKQFKGNKLLEIRGKKSEGYKINPGQIPFHLPNLIENIERNPKWSNPNSIESFWQCNKIIVVKHNIDLNLIDENIWLDIEQFLNVQTKQFAKLKHITNQTIWKYLSLKKDLSELLVDMDKNFINWANSIIDNLLMDYKASHEIYKTKFAELLYIKNKAEFMNFVLSKKDKINASILIAMYHKNEIEIDRLVWASVKPKQIKHYS